MRRRLVYSLVALALSGMLLQGCGGGGAKTQVEATTVSKGQALLDLKKALDAGAISQGEYDKQRQKLLNQ
jgi:hypothetical protein